MSSEGTLIEKTPHPVTRATLARDFLALGLQPGSLVLVHSSLSALGWVNGGPVAVIQALMDVLTPEGTLVMPAHSGDLSDPAKWVNPPVPADWLPEIYATMPAFDPALTPSRGMGRIGELFRTWPGVLRSNHPAVSFAAWGRQAAEITAGHQLDSSLGDGSPLARIYERDGLVMLLGVTHANNTSLHLAEYRQPAPPYTQQGAPIMENGQRVWKWFTEVDYDDEPFAQLGAEFDALCETRISPVGCGTARLMRQRSVVDFAVRWLANRPARKEG